MKNRFELFIALRYLRARRKQAVISIITVISVVGVAAGVMALVIALAITNGFRNTLQRNLLGATSHVMLLEKQPQYGIEEWRKIVAKTEKLPHVLNASPTLYGPVFLSGLQSKGAVLKGMVPENMKIQSDMLRNLKEGSVDDLDKDPDVPGIILGSRLAQELGMLLNARVTVISPMGETTPMGPRSTERRFRVVGIFESGFYELDANWSYTSLKTAQAMLAYSDVVNAIEYKVDDVEQAPAVADQVAKVAGPAYAGTHWKEQNKPILNALKMERTVTVITIGLIQMVAALNILIALVMMVMEKTKDIAILMSMGARHRQIRRIFMMQGVTIGVVGSIIGLILGYGLSFIADRYRWLRLDEEVYSLSYVPFDARWTDALWIAGAAILVSFLATIYPARNASRIAPVEALRYE